MLTPEGETRPITSLSWPINNDYQVSHNSIDAATSSCQPQQMAGKYWWNTLFSLVDHHEILTSHWLTIMKYSLLIGWQGGSVLWKGIGSSLTIKGLTLGVEDCLSKVTPWPKDVDAHTSLKMLGQHLMLKCVSTALITPFYSARWDLIGWFC